MILDPMRQPVKFGSARCEEASTGKPPPRGYSLLEPGEARSDSGDGLRLVRIGAHALAQGSKINVRSTPQAASGLSSGGGNHRGSIFRLLVEESQLARDDCAPRPILGR